jgi:hypothetical protein
LDPAAYKFVINPESIVLVNKKIVNYVVYFFLEQTNGGSGGRGVVLLSVDKTIWFSPKTQEIS